jgi:hypothetical protein
VVVAQNASRRSSSIIDPQLLIINKEILVVLINPLPSGTLAAFFLTAVGPIQHTKEGDIGRDKSILMTSLWLDRAAAVSRRQ